MYYQKTYLIIYFLVLGAFSSYSQVSEERIQEIESAKIALLTERLQLSPSQAEKFWPLYNEYSAKKKALLNKLHHEGRGRKKEEITEEKAKKILEERFQLRRQELLLDEKYIPQMIQATSAKQVFALEAAEREFRRMLLQRLRGRR